MFTYEHQTLRLYGVPVFTLVVGMIFLASWAGLLFGITQWKRPAGKIAVFASSCVLALFFLAIVAILITVGSGSMG